MATSERRYEKGQAMRTLMAGTDYSRCLHRNSNPTTDGKRTFSAVGSERFSEAVERLAQAALVAAGYHQHHRGEWRRVRGQSADQVC